MLADELDYVLGLDTHPDEHVLAVVTAPAGAVVAGAAVPANARGYRELLRLAGQHAPSRRAWAIEGTGSYGALAQLRAVLVTAPEPRRQELRRLPEGKLLDRCSRFRRTGSVGVDELVTRIVLRSLARRIRAATEEADKLERQILAHVRALAPTLLDEPGVGPIVAAQVIVAWSRAGRLRSEACFARLAGVAPVPEDETSGQLGQSAHQSR